MSLSAGFSYLTRLSFNWYRIPRHFSRSNPRRGWTAAPRASSIWRHIDQRGDQTQERLMLRSARAGAEKHAEFNVRQTAARWSAGLVNDEGPAVLRFTAQVPRIAVRTTV